MSGANGHTPPAAFGIVHTDTCPGHCWHVERHEEEIGEARDIASGTPGRGVKGQLAEHLREHELLAAQQKGAAEETVKTMRLLRQVAAFVGFVAVLFGIDRVSAALAFVLGHH